MADIVPNSAPATDELAHVTQEMYKKNLELADRNKTLALLRKIDEVVLSSAEDITNVAKQVTDTIIAETDFSLAIIYLYQDKKILPFAVSHKAAPTELEKAVFALLTDNLAADHPVANALNSKETIVTTMTALISNQVNGHSDKVARSLGVETVFIAPLVVRSKIIGGILIGSPQPEAEISEFKRTLIDRLVGVIAIAMDSSMLYQELQSANEHLKELDKAKDDFISMASHQLRTPLTTIKGYVSMVEEGDTGEITAQQRKFLDSAMTGATRMGKMIAELLNVSRMDTGKFKIDPKPVDLAKVVQDEVEQLMLHADSRGLKLGFINPSKPINCELDEDKTRQVIMNFIDNAIYYTKQGGITVTVDQDDTKVTLKVTDTGIGVPEAVKAKMFSKFYRADNAKVARPDGTGLGLFLAKRVVEDQGGKVIFESTEGKGSTFGFELPNKVKPADNGASQ